MNPATWKSAAMVLASAAGLLGMDAASRYLPQSGAFEGCRGLLRITRLRDLNRINLDSESANYYESLIDHGTFAIPTSALVTGWFVWGRTWLEYESVLMERHADFLGYGLRPNMRLPSPAGALTTNRFGMADQEYTLRKPPHTRRIALLGDSITRGLGTPSGNAFESLLERRLNQQAGERFEILNFAVGGYQMTRFPAVAEKAQVFEPDVYLVSLTLLDTDLSPQWADHLQYLVSNHIDPKYPFLRGLIGEARLAVSDTRLEARQKLAPYLLRVMRWSLAELQSCAARNHAELLVILTPSVREPALLDRHFESNRALLRELGIPFIDALDAFASLASRDALRIDENDPDHPNSEGHRIIAEQLYRKMRADPAFWLRFAGGQSYRPATATGRMGEPVAMPVHVHRLLESGIPSRQAPAANMLMHPR